MRRLAAIAIALAALAGWAGPGTALAAVGPTLSASGDAKFPGRSYILTLPPGVTPGPGDIVATENGAKVDGLKVEPANTEQGQRFGAVLVLDASLSMRGQAIGKAMAAARAFARNRAPAQPLGVVTYNKTATVLLPPTTDAAAIRDALAAPPRLRGGTHIYDAVTAAARLLHRGGIDAGSVVLLSDGLDTTGGSATLASATRALRAVNARVYTVGLRSRDFLPHTIIPLSRATGGQYVKASSPAALTSIYRRLGAELSNAYVVRYRSTARPGVQVHVAVKAGDVGISDAYVAPTTGPLGGVKRRLGADDGWLDSTASIIGVALLFSLLAFAAIAMSIVAHDRRVGVHRRVTAYADEAAPSTDPLAGIPGLDPEAGQRRERAAWIRRLAEALELGQIAISPVRFVMLVVALCIVAACLFVAVSGFVLLAPVVVATGVAAARAFAQSRIAKQRKLFADQLADSVQVLASAMRAGHSFTGAMSILIEDAPEPTARELRRVIADERLGVSMEDALGETVRRMENRDLEQVALVATLQRDTGGNGAEALDRVVDTIRGRNEVRRLVNTLTAQGRMSRWVLTGLPVGLLLLLSVIGKGYVDPMFHTTIGNVALGIGAALLVAGSLWIKKVVEIKV